MALESRVTELRSPAATGLASWGASASSRAWFLVITGVATLLPVLAIIGFLLSTASGRALPLVPILLLGLGVGCFSTLLVALALRMVLAPLTLASSALRAARTGATDTPDATDQVGAVLTETQRTLHHLTATIADLEHDAATDPLTGQLNRRAGEQRLHAALATGASQIAVVLLDVDGLKGVNDRWGHAAGDAALSHLAAVLAQHVAGHGWVARWGGDEFLVVFTEPAGLTAEQLLAEVAADIAAKPLAVTHDGRARLGVSWGLAWPAPGETGPTVVSRADAALYRVKHQPRRPGHRLNAESDFS